MSGQRREKIKWLLDQVPAGYLVDMPTLERHGISRQMARKYAESGWLQPLIRGVYRRSGTRGVPDPLLIVRSLQSIMSYNSFVGGRTALGLQGHAHYLSEDRQIHLYGEAHPTWLKRLPDSRQFILHTTRLFDPSISDLNEIGTQYGSIVCSTPERAILELLDELPGHESFHIADKMFESLVSARPRRLEKLLSACRSVKVKRLFFVFADRHNHAWRRYLSPEQFNLGKGPRALVEGGRFHPKYHISVPPEFLQEDLGQNGA